MSEEYISSRKAKYSRLGVE